MQTDNDFRRAIESIKLRAPIEELVRERVPELKQSGRRWWACCPFHDEDTPSFSVDPRAGLWHCFGACATGGDQISFLQQIDHLDFMDAVEILATRTGVELPRRSRTDRRQAEDPGWTALERAGRFYAQALRSPEGKAALDYLRGRKLSDATIEAFGLGYAPSSGRALVNLAQGREGGARLEHYKKAGLVRTADSGRPYDFFRGRLVIPIRELKGRVCGFGARRLGDEREAGPKYINSSETDFFHKGRLVYALDRAVDAVRRGGHLVLVEGYTDVMAAHQVGLLHVAAVLGTSTTDDHAGLVRRAGARRVSLVFDGDEAGRAAAYKALAGLLPLAIELEVVCLPNGVDPCDLLIERGAEAFQAELDRGQNWFDFVADGLAGLRAAELSHEVDRVLELMSRISKPVHRESMLVQLADRIGIPVESLREQWKQLPERRQAAARRGAERAHEGRPAAPVPPAARPVDPRTRRAFEGLAGAVILDSSLLPLVRPFVAPCPDAELKFVLECILELYEDEDASIDANAVLAQLGDHPARARVALLIEYASAADSPKVLLDGELSYLRRRQLEFEKRRIQRQISELELAVSEGRDDARESLSELLERLSEIHRVGCAPQPH